MLSRNDRTLLLGIARERIVAELEGRPPLYPEPTPALGRRSGAFVSLHVDVRGEPALRGCIGRIEPDRSLAETVREMAGAAAFRDPRFPPLTSDELPRITLEISVLSPLERIPPAQADPGTHGLFIRLRGRSGLLLPQVAASRRWDRETFLRQTCRKAGLAEGAWRDPDAELFAFTAEVFDASTPGASF